MANENRGNEVVESAFEVVASESEKTALANNLENFEIVKIDENAANSTNNASANGVNFSNFSDSAVKISTEIFKDGLISNKAAQLFKCDTSIDKLMRIKDGFGSQIRGSDGKIIGQAKFSPASGDMAKIISPFLALQVASVALGQYFMLQIDEKLGQILDIVKEISKKIEQKEKAKLKTIVSEIMEIKTCFEGNQKFIDKSTIDKLEHLKGKAKEVFYFYETKIEDTNIEKINFGNNKRFKSRIDGLEHNIGEFKLNVDMYRKSKEVLIFIYQLLYVAYMQNSDFNRAETMFNTLKQNDKAFDDEMSSKLFEITKKILEQFKYIQDNKDLIPNMTLKPFDTLIDKSPLPKKAKSAIKKATDFLLITQPIIYFPKEKIHKMATNDKDENTAKPHIERFSKLQKDIKKNNSKAIQDNAKFIQQIEQKRTIYYAQINGDKYALIEKTATK